MKCTLRLLHSDFWMYDLGNIHRILLMRWRRTSQMQLTCSVRVENVLFVSSTLTWECPERPEQRELPRFETVCPETALKPRSFETALTLFARRAFHRMLPPAFLGPLGLRSTISSSSSLYVASSLGFGQPSAAHHL